jgi:lysozyme family protein
MSLEQAIAFTIPQEGGFVNNPDDDGGPTDHGITQATYDDYRDSLKLPPQDVQLITDADTQTIYTNMYWTPAKCPLLSDALAICHFDWAVNHGVTGAIKTLQQTLGVTADGVFGSQTAIAAAAASEDVWQQYNNLRRAWYRTRATQNTSQQQFLAGWLDRVNALDAYVRAL